MTRVRAATYPTAARRIASARTALWWSAILISATLLIIPVVIPVASADRWLLVQGASMSPALNIGDIVVIDTNITPSVGDIVTARRSDNSLVTHRVQSIDRDAALTLRGDANSVPDPNTVPPESVVGTVAATVAAPWSTLFRAITSIAGRLTLIGTIALLVLCPSTRPSKLRTSGLTANA